MMPNITTIEKQPIICYYLAILLLIAYVKAEVPQTNKAARDKNHTSFSRDVTDLKLTSDFRSVKLSWTYQHNDSNVPVAFDVRFCEITSWNIEIKCRHKELEVDSWRQNVTSQSGSKVDLDSSVITKPSELVRNFDREFRYEAHIYDLRALTNYTFLVRVLRFSDEPVELVRNPQPSGRSRASARRLETGELSNKLAARVETKAFAAEATKCLADVTEVVVNTGRYFGGRISAEDSLDPRCGLVGNKSSEQSSYLLRIDHQVCNSRVMNGNRIETMVLVHENKDILTHNSARFLVLCHFHQKSYTLRASVSLPKVNGVANRPALITTLPKKPEQSQARANATLALDHQETKSVMLGSMPGIYRARSQPQRHNSRPENWEDFPRPDVLANRTIERPRETFKRTPSANASSPSGDELDELANAVEKDPPRKLESQSSGRRVDLSGQNSSAASEGPNSVDQLRASRGRAMKLSAEARESSQSLPQPVHIQSKVLYVDRSSLFSFGNSSSAGQLPPNAVIGFHQAVSALKPPAWNNSTSAIQIGSASFQMDQEDSRRAGEAKWPLKQLDEESGSAPIIMSNNHRIGGDFLPLAALIASSRASANNETLKHPSSDNSTEEISIKYSAAQVNEFPVALEEPAPKLALGGSYERNLRARNGRMRAIEEDRLSDERTQLTAGNIVATNIKDHRRDSGDSDVDRMGEMNLANGSSSSSDLIADASDKRVQEQQANEESLLTSNQGSNNNPNNTSTSELSLAQNITGYLLRWSLRTLTNLARKSLEGLVIRRPGNSSAPFDGRLSEANHYEAEEEAAAAEERGKSGYFDGIGMPSNAFRTAAEPAKETVKQAALNGDTSERAKKASSTLPPTTSQRDEEALAGETEKSSTLGNSRKPSMELMSHKQTTVTTGRPTGLSNYSKSLDLNAAAAASPHPPPDGWSWSLSSSRNNNNGIKSDSNHGINQEPTLELQQQKQRSNQDKSTSAQLFTNDDNAINLNSTHQEHRSLRDNKRNLLYSSWFLYGLLLFLSLVTGVFLVFWLVSLYATLIESARRTRGTDIGAAQDGSHFAGKIARRPLQAIVQFHDQLQPKHNNNNNNKTNDNNNDNDNKLADSNVTENGQTNSNGVAMGAALRAYESASYQKYDYCGGKFSNNTHAFHQSTNSAFNGPTNGSIQYISASPSNSPHGTTPRSTSANSSSLLVDQADCRNSELLYTEHVLINTGGESFA